MSWQWESVWLRVHQRQILKHLMQHSGPQSSPILMSFAQWLDANGTGLLDLRPPVAPDTPPGHCDRLRLVGSTRVPLFKLEACLFELPPPGAEELAILVATVADAQVAMQVLSGRNFRVWCTLLSTDAALWTEAAAAGVVVPEDEFRSRPLWHAAPCLRNYIDRVESGLASLCTLCITHTHTHTHTHTQTPPPFQPGLA